MKNDKVSIKLSLKTAWLSQILFFFFCMRCTYSYMITVKSGQVHPPKFH